MFPVSIVHFARASSIIVLADNSRQSVVSLAYSNCNELLSAVYADGGVCTFGLKTSVRLDKFTLDSNPSMLRFHPQRRYSAAIATDAGIVQVWDVLAKRTLWRDKHAHSSPVPEVCWSPNDENMLLSAGYDCMLNVFDIRQRQVAIQIKHDTPFSCAAVASGAAGGVSGGPFVAAGTLKGDLCAYDLRSARDQLAFRKSAHESQVSRVAFGNDCGGSGAVPSSSVLVAESGAAAAVPTEAAASTTLRVPNILGGGRRRSISGRTSTANLQRAHLSSAQVDLRASLSGVRADGAAFADNDDDEHNSFNAFLDRNTKVRVSLAPANRRDSLLEMEVRPVRFADISDSEISIRAAETPPDAKAPTMPKPTAPPQMQRRSRTFQQIIHEDVSSDVQQDSEARAGREDESPMPPRERNVTLRNDPVRKILREKEAAPNVFVMSSTINDSPGMSTAAGSESGSSMMLLRADKENYVAASPIIGHKPATAHSTAVLSAVPNDPAARAQLDQLLDERFAALAARLEAGQSVREAHLVQHVGNVAQRVEQMHFDVMTTLWCLADTDLTRLRNDAEATLRGVQMLALSNTFVQEFVELKEENERLRHQVAALKGDPAPGPRM